MALRPLDAADERAVEQPPTPQPSKTYRLDFRRGRIRGLIDGQQAAHQAVRKALTTARRLYLVYNADYGSELPDLLGEDITVELLETEIPRLVREALLADDRFVGADRFDIQRDKNKVYVRFRVLTADGAFFDEEVTL